MPPQHSSPGAPPGSSVAAGSVEAGTADTQAAPPVDAQVKKAIRELLDVLPADVIDELNQGQIDLRDSAFLDGLTDHVSRLSLANPRGSQRILGKIIRLKKLITRSLRSSDPEVVVSNTIARTGERVGRNSPCPCGSGRKYKQCCLRKA